MPSNPSTVPFPTPLSNEAAWERLPQAIKGQGAPLPIWARQLAAFLPKTTASLLALDYAQRASNPIPPRLRAAMRLISAHTVGSEAALKVAVKDAELAGMTEAQLELDPSDWTLGERRAIEFMYRMAHAPAGIEDRRFQELIGYFGEQVTASMVLLSAYASFHNRLLICLGTPASDCLPSQEIIFAPEQLVSSTTPPSPRIVEEGSQSAFENEVETFHRWSVETFEQLQEKLEAQRQKPTRLPIPDWETCAKNLPPGLINKPSDIIWYRIVFGYAPELAVPFEYFMRTSGSEADGKWDRIFATSLFWVTTKAIDCPYCMGHCEMNFEVAGLSKEEIAARSRFLASDDWSSFPPREQRAFAFAHKLNFPIRVTPSDITQLRQDFGDEAALIIMLNACRYHYMTRISNGFQLTLERENVFFDYYNVKAER